jgi:hypothetical protein
MDKRFELKMGIIWLDIPLSVRISGNNRNVWMYSSLILVNIRFKSVFWNKKLAGHVVVFRIIAYTLP